MLSWTGRQDFCKAVGLWNFWEGLGSSSSTSAGSEAASCLSCLPSWDLIPLLVTEGSWTQAQPKCSSEGEAAQLSQRRRKILIKHSNLDLQPINT